MLSDIITASQIFYLRPDETHRVRSRELVVGSWTRWLMGFKRLRPAGTAATITAIMAGIACQSCPIHPIYDGLFPKMSEANREEG